ncbi:purine or other phosphorylase family 1 [Caldicellulosiruptor hydrothermalis 108]|uniref:Purine or other phosphorylase family 1 n=1 Tax=Caldicellulosiruptor hydrothermalis (strain DSM 18901 / VKM B-2411 / 108) TaxID=632292 RepID=E4QBQ2_CALH1|nr:purine or other phosphorylase family 1 [Caldicellulosiruptor hydrothermalis]ADQ07268.1 purine or other phosphorylase family 1 [Caldicellulosiruptor hydrothermalis 108]
MIYLITAFYSEAKALIDHFGLKKLYEPSKFQIFSGDEILLIVSGEGILQAAIATTFALTKFGASDRCIALNIGICGAKEKKLSKGDVLLCNKIINHHSKKTFYPDILITHQMKEASLESFLHPVKKDTFFGEIEGDIVDMEGAGFFEAASSFLAPHNVQCIKIVYDFLAYEKIEPQEVTILVKQCMPFIENFINTLVDLNLKFCTNIFEEEKLRQIIEKLKSSLRLTASITFQLEKLLKSYIIRHENLPEEISEFFNVNVNSKKEGKQYFEKLKKLLIS